MHKDIVTVSCIARFHHFHLARQLEKHRLLKEIWTGYPRFKLKDEQGIPNKKIKTFPWLQTPYMARNILKLHKMEWLNREWAWLAHETLDKHVAKHIKEKTVFIGLSGGGLYSGIKTKLLGGKYICDRGSSHILEQDSLLREEYKIWNIKYKGIDSRKIDKEIKEYEEADIITIPSTFSYNSFIKKGIPEHKLRQIPYGANLSRFKRVGEPSKDTFRVLWVGAISLQKGFLYLLQAFDKLETKHKELIVIGGVSEDIKPLIKKFNTENVIFKGIVPNKELNRYYSTSHVFVLSSIQEGLALVQGEALACGCPVIATPNTGGEDLFSDGEEGFIVPIRSVEAIYNKLQLLLDNTLLQKEMSAKAVNKIKTIGGWDKYGDTFSSLVKTLYNE